MKLAFIKKKFSVHGGAEQYLRTLIEHLAKDGHEIHLFANRWTPEEHVIFHKVGLLPVSSFLSVVTFNMNAGRAVAQAPGFDRVISFERTTSQDIYRAGEGCHAEWLEIRAKSESRFKTLSFGINPLHLALLGIEKRLFSNTKLIIANSHMVKGQIMKHYAVAEKRIRVVYNGVDTGRFSPANRERWRGETRRELGVPEGSVLVLFVGSGFERKGLGTLVKALSFLKKENVKVAVVGKGDAGRYRSLAERAGVPEKIDYLEPRSGVERFYAAADLFVLPTRYDPFSNAALEAMASGLPVITTHHNGVAELIDNGKEGYVMDDLYDPRELADKISLSLGNLKPMGAHAGEKAQQFSIGRAVTEFTQAIREVENK